MDFKDCIIFKTHGSGSTHNEGGRIAIPRTSILSICTKTVRNYSASTDEEVTHLFVTIDIAEKLGYTTESLRRKDKGVFIPIGDRFEIALGILRGDKAVEVLFGDKVE